MDELTIFRFGYEGWGNHTKQLVEAADAVEGSRGFLPPCFVDTRIRRAVRAKGFVGNAFGQLLHDRYRWMKGLGNRAILDGIEGIQIADPAAADTLLEDVVDAASRRQRLIYFCSCKWAKLEGEVYCHRMAIEGLLRKAAHRRGIPLRVVEWPGSDPSEVALEATRPLLRSVERGSRKSLPLEDQARELGRFAGLGWGSVLHLSEPSGATADVLAGPAQFTSTGWQLPVLEPVEGKAAEVAGRRWREQHGCD